MTVRERYRLTLVAIESVLANTAIPYRFIFAHGHLPEWLVQALAVLSRAGRLELRHLEGVFWPQQLRKAVIAEVDTEFVVFIDNDVLMSPGWLERLIECADETGAGAVGPVYLWGDGASPARVHMAGGILRQSRFAEGNVLEEHHRHLDADPAKIAGTLKRGPCDFLEFHCMLVRTELARQEGVLDDAITCVHEHIDMALGLRGKGQVNYVEPAAQATYLAFAPQVLEDLPVMRERWDLGAMERSISAFCAKWDVLPDERSFSGVRTYVRDLRGRHDPLRLNAAWNDLERLMEPGELAQTRSELMDAALARGYTAPELSFLSKSCQVAASLVDGGYRPCGRPFIQHLIGTAGVLLRYDFCPEVVVEGLLHAAYSHRRLAAAEVQAMLTGIHAQVELRVRDYTQRGGRIGAQSPAMSSIRDAEIAAIEAANEIDMRLSGEYDYSGRPAELGADQSLRLVRILELLGVRGMAATLQAAQGATRNVPRELVTGINVSYRIGPGQTLTRMAAEPSPTDSRPGAAS